MIKLKEEFILNLRKITLIRAHKILFILDLILEMVLQMHKIIDNNRNWTLHQGIFSNQVFFILRR